VEETFHSFGGFNDRAYTCPNQEQLTEFKEYLKNHEYYRGISWECSASPSVIIPGRCVKTYTLEDDPKLDRRPQLKTVDVNK
jgi:hypothetical protein